MATHDDGIQLNGKQLVFVFMAVTVVSVVIFLCGVLVGRGAQARTAVPVEAALAPETDATADADPPPPGADPLEPTKADGLVYSDRLQTTGPAAEQLVPQSEQARTQPPASPAPTRAAAPAATATARRLPAEPDDDPPAARDTPPPEEKPLPPEPKGDGMAIQVAALRGRTEADAVVARLKGKGYAAYLVPSVAGQPAGFRVRVGKFKTRAEAEKIAARLEQGRAVQALDYALALLSGALLALSFPRYGHRRWRSWRSCRSWSR